MKRETWRRGQGPACSLGARVEADRTRDGRDRRGPVDITTDKEFIRYETSKTSIFLDTCCRNLDLDSKSLRPSVPHETTSKLYTHQSSPTVCSCSAICLEEKEFHSVPEDHAWRSSKRTFSNHTKPGPDYRHNHLSARASSNCKAPTYTVSEVRGPLNTVNPGSAALPLTWPKKISRVLHPGPSSTVQVPLPSRHLPFLKILQTLHNVAGATEK